MRILLLGMGSRGDVQPLVALGQRLRRMGYAVSLAAPADLGHVVAGTGLDFEPLSFDLEGPLREGLGRDSLRGSARTQVREARLMRRVMAGTAEALAADVARLVDGADAVVSGALTFDLVDALLTPDGGHGGGRPMKPHLYAVFAPVWPSAHGDSVALALRPRASSPVNRAWSALAGRVALDLFRPAGDLVRARKGLPRRHFRHYTAAAESTPTLLAASPSVVPPAADWPPALRQTGYWVRDDVAAALEPALEAFLAAGDAPVFVGFGSMPTPTPPVSRATSPWCSVVSACAASSARVSPVWASSRLRSCWASGPPRTRACFPGAPSSSTTAGPGPRRPRCVRACRRSSCRTPPTSPTGAGGWPTSGSPPPPIARKDLTAARLERALEVALSPGARQAAYALGERVRAEDGAGDAARLVDSYLTGPGRAGA